MPLPASATNTSSPNPTTPPARRRRLILALGLAVLLVVAAAALLFRFRTRPDPDLIWRQAQNELHAEQIDRAEADLKRITQLRSPTILDWFLRAQVAMARARTDEALADLAKIWDHPQHGAQARLMAGQLELRRHRLRPAEEAFLGALALDPKLVQARRELIYIYGVQLRRQPLHEQFRALSELMPLTFDNVFHWCLTRNTLWEPQELSEMMTRFLQADPDDRWSRLSLAESLRSLGRRGDAEKQLESLPASDPDARAIRVRLALDRGDDQAAESLLSEGPRDHPELARLRGRLAMARGDGAAALRHFRLALAAEPDNRDTVFGLSGALSLLGDQTEAAKYRALARDHDLLGSLMQKASTPTHRNDPALFRQLGAACEAIHRLPEARSWYNLLITQDPLDKEAQQALFRVKTAIAAEKAKK